MNVSATPRRACAALLFAALAAATPARAFAEDPAPPAADALSLVLHRYGSNPGDEQRAQLEPDGTLAVRAVRMLGQHRESAVRELTLPPRLMAGLRAEIDRLAPFAYPALPDPLEPDEVPLVILDLRIGERRFQRSYAFRHLYADLPDLELLRTVDLCTGLSLVLGDRLFEAARTWQQRSQPVYAVHFLRMSIQSLEQALPPGDEDRDSPNERDRREALDLENKKDYKNAYVRYERTFQRRREEIKSWFRERGLLDAAPWFDLTASKGPK